MEQQTVTLRIAYDPEDGEGPPSTWDWTAIIDSRDDVVVVSADEPVEYNPIIESPSAWSYRRSQENGDQVDCQECGDPLNDDLPIVNDAEGYAYHEGCLTEPKTYKIVRFFFSDLKPREIVQTGLTLEEAHAYCNREDTKGGSTEDGTAWFDGYEEE